MPDSSNPQILQRIIGISNTSARKSHYPQLQRTIAQLQAEIAERKQAEATLRATLARLERQNRAMERLSSHQATGPVDGAITMACAVLAQALTLSRATVWRFLEQSAIAVESNPAPQPNAIPLPDATFYASLAAAPLAVADATTDAQSRALWQALGHEHPGGFIAAPILDDRGYWGMLTGEDASAPRPWFPDEIAFLGRMAAHLTSLLMIHQIQQLRKFLANVVDSMPSALIALDREGHITQWNHYAEATTGKPTATVLGRTLTEVAPHLRPCLFLAQQALATRAPQSLPRQVRSDGNQVIYEDITVYPLVTNGVDGVVIRVDDVTERHRMEQMLLQSEKMLSVGGLAAGMAHEINNPLASILGNAQVLASRLTSRHPANLQAATTAGIDFAALQAYLEARGVPPMLSAIQEAARRAATLVVNMLSFSRTDEGRVRPTNLAELMRTTLELAATDYDLKKKYDFRRIGLEFHAAPDLPAVHCSESKIQQVFLNILRNGAEAMAEKDYPPGEAPRFTIHMERVGERVQVRIADNGPGMEEAVRARVFEPFFTTKPPGKGTGLGLSVSYFIITQEHGGHLTVESTPGEGACYTIQLPVAPPTKTEATRPPQDVDASPQG